MLIEREFVNEGTPSAIGHRPMEAFAGGFSRHLRSLSRR